MLETSEWREVADLDLSDRLIVENADLPGRPQVWMEQKSWKGKTGGRSIVTLILAELPLSSGALRSGVTKSTSKTGISWIEWSPDGSMLAVRNGERKAFSIQYNVGKFLSLTTDEDAAPSSVFIFALTAVEKSTTSRFHRPFLHSVLVLSQAIRKAVWRPSQRVSQTELAVVCASEALYIWRLHDEGEVCEGIPIPILSFRANDAVFAPDASKLLLVSETETYCCAVDS